MGLKEAVMRIIPTFYSSIKPLAEKLDEKLAIRILCLFDRVCPADHGFMYVKINLPFTFPGSVCRTYGAQT
jgi:hypothetical protein